MLRALILLCAFTAGLARATEVQTYPARPIRLIMPNAPGSSADTMGRIVAVRLGDTLGQPIVIDNRAGAGGTIGLDIGKNAAPDGYTLVATSLSALTVSPHIRKDLPYDPIKDFEYIASYSRQANVLVVNPALPVKTVRELIDYAKTRQGRINMASAGSGSQSHLNGTAFMKAAGFESVHVPYKGGGPSVAAVVAGESQWTLTPAGALMTLVRAGKLRALGHSFPQRSSLFPDIPPIGELVPGFSYVAMSGYLAPRGTPRPLLQKIWNGMKKALSTNEVREQFAFQGAEVALTTPEEFRKAIQDELVETGKIVRAIGLKAAE